MAVTTTALPACSGSITPSYVIRIVIPKAFDMATVSRNVKFKLPPAAESEQAEEAIDDAGDVDGDSAYGADVSGNPDSPFHVDLRNVSTTATGYAELRVVLRDRNYSFFVGPDTESTPKTIYGVGIGGVTNPLQMCGAQTINSTQRFKVVVFYVKFNTGSGSPITSSYNIGLTNLNAVDTPIFVDPAVTNDG
jgi:hypothetical protein